MFTPETMNKLEAVYGTNCEVLLKILYIEWKMVPTETLVIIN